MIKLTDSEVDRFWSKVGHGPGCWEWTGETNNRGYGRFVIYRSGSRYRLLAHRVAYALVTGVDIDDVVARHQCDNPPCCNPDDLLTGTQLDNMGDAVSRGRMNLTGLAIGRVRNRAVALEIVQSGRKLCPGCVIVKPLDEFHRSSRTLHGRQSRCKSCQALRKHERRLLSRDRVRVG